VAKKQGGGGLDFNFGLNRKPRRRPSGKRTPAQQAAYQKYFGKGRKK
jgi:hypothetical protein